MELKVKSRHMGRAWLAVALMASLPFGAAAEDSNKGPVAILVGFAAGGTTDITARLIAETMKGSLGRAIIVENKPGAGGSIAAEALKHASPDGATIMFAPIAVPVVAPLIFKHPGYDPARDFAPVTQVLRFQLAFAVSPNHPARTMQEFVVWAKEHPNLANFGTPAAGSLSHLFGMEIGRAAGIDMVHIAYKGLPPLAGDLMAGRIPAAIDALPDLIELHKAGKLRIIATSGASRSPLTPTVATFKEQGYPSLTATSWIGVYAPARTPEAVIKNLSSAIAVALQVPELRESLIKRGYEPTGTSAEELASIMADDTAHWAPIIKAAGFSVE